MDGREKKEEKKNAMKAKKAAAAAVRRETHIKSTKTTVSLMKMNADLKNLQLNIARVETLLRSYDLSDENRKQLEGKLEVWKGILDKAELPPLTEEEMKKRMDIIEGNPGLLEVFNAFWVTVLYYTIDDDVDVNNAGVLVNQRLDKKGYFKFNRNIYIALTDQRSLEKQDNYLETRWCIDTRHITEDEALAAADDDGGFEMAEDKKKKVNRRESDLAGSRKTFSVNVILDEGDAIKRRASEMLPSVRREMTRRDPRNKIQKDITNSRLASRGVKMKKEDFFHMLYNILDIWAELLDKQYYAVFAWSLLESIADTTVYPPKLRAANEVTCTTKIENEAGMWANYVQTGKVRHALSVQADTVEKIPGCIRRLAARKKAKQISELEALRIKKVYERMKKEGKIQSIEEGEATDSDEERLIKMEKKLRERLLKGASGASDGDDSDGDSEESMWSYDSDGNRVKRNGRRRGGKGTKGDGRKIYAFDMQIKDTTAMRNRRREKHDLKDKFDMKNQGLKKMNPNQRKLMDKLNTSNKKSVDDIRRFQDKERKRKVLRSSILRKLKDMDGDILDYWKYGSSTVGHQAIRSVDDMQGYGSSSNENMWDVGGGDQGTIDGGSVAGSSVGTKDTLMKLEEGLVNARVRSAEWNNKFMNEHTEKRLSTIYNKYAGSQNTRNLEAELDKEGQMREKVKEAATVFQKQRKQELKQQKAAFMKYKALAKERFESRKKMTREMEATTLDKGTKYAKALVRSIKEQPLFARDKTALDLLLHAGEIDFSQMPEGSEEGSIATIDSHFAGNQREVGEQKKEEEEEAQGSGGERSGKKENRKLSVLVSDGPLVDPRAASPPTATTTTARLGLGPTRERGVAGSLMEDSYSVTSLDLGSGTYNLGHTEGTSPIATGAGVSLFAETEGVAINNNSPSHLTMQHHPPTLPSQGHGGIPTYSAYGSVDTEDQMRTLTSHVVSNVDALAMKPGLEKDDSYRDSPLLPELNITLDDGGGGGGVVMESDMCEAAELLQDWHADDNNVYGDGGGELSRAMSAPGASRSRLSQSPQKESGDKTSFPSIEIPATRPRTTEGARERTESASNTPGPGFGVLRADSLKFDTTSKNTDPLHPLASSLTTISATNWFDVSVLGVDVIGSDSPPTSSVQAGKESFTNTEFTDRLFHLDEAETERAILKQTRLERKLARKMERERRKAYLSADILYVRSKMRDAYKLVM